MKLRYAILYVRDPAASLAFYEAAFDLKRRMLHPDGDYGELETGSTRLGFSALGLMAQLGKDVAPADPHRPSFELAFETEDVGEALKRALDAGAVLVQEAQDMPWGQTTSYVRDPDGFLVEICSPVAKTDAAQ
ncbi:MAG: VOC family protein [Myxococcota bacterium]